MKPARVGGSARQERKSMLQPDPDEIIEATRRERMRTLLNGMPHALPEASHSASVLMKAVDDHLAGHPAVAACPDLYRLAYRAFENLFALHQALGEESNRTKSR
ncbi:hypothetical protein ACFOYU_23735 [Microvirga sp. GCM10011540]|uniref:hypothetical protein n=1 Tax=Microvirga sp. GCM10011540 TaxID=3317338 RepID=UPI00361CCDAF